MVSPAIRSGLEAVIEGTPVVIDKVTSIERVYVKWFSSWVRSHDLLFGACCLVHGHWGVPSLRTRGDRSDLNLQWDSPELILIRKPQQKLSCTIRIGIAL